MKGSKEGKADGGKAAGPTMFPRLHVTETKKAGPRGPPRNKMALYEQLTIPSRRFKPTSVPLPSSGRVMNDFMTTPILQPQVHASSYDSRYSYVPMSYMSSIIPTMAYMPMMNVGMYGVGGGGGGTATSSMNASSTRSTVVDATTESQRVPRGAEAVSRRRNSSGHSKASAGSKRGKEDDDFAVPTYSGTQGSTQTRATANCFQVQQDLRGGRSVQKGKERLVMKKRSGACVDQVRRIRKERSMEDDASWTSASVECVTVSAVDDDVNTQGLSNRKVDGGRRHCDSSEVELNAGVIRQERAKEQKVEGLTKQSNTTTTSGAAPAEVVHEMDSFRAVPERDVFSGQSSENQSGEVSEPSQPRRGSSAETDLSMLENVASGSICFPDVVDAFGQQEFWKAQNTIMRQQKIFAQQVFELHRVIEVQQLLAKTSSLSLNIDEVLEEEEADNVPTPAGPVADVPGVPEIPERGVEADGRQSSDENSRPVPEAVCQPIYPLSVPSQLDFNSGAAWQAAPFGANPWAARMPSPFMYVPYPGPCSPGYGVYPSMGAAMSMYGSSGGMQAARFPSWQQPGMSQPWGAQESVAAAAAWYGQQPGVPAVGPTATMGIVSGACIPERPTSAVDQPIQGSKVWKGTARQSGERSDVGVNRSNKVDAVKTYGWAKGWASTEDRLVRRELEISQSKECVAGPSAGFEVCRRDGEVGRGDAGCGVGQQIDNGVELAEHEERGGEPSGCGLERLELESERSWPAGARQEEPLQSRTLKRTRLEVPDCDVSPWFRIMSPSRRMIQQNGVNMVVPRAVSATPESAASILLSIQNERQR